jgi:hypothetical protein
VEAVPARGQIPITENVLSMGRGAEAVVVAPLRLVVDEAVVAGVARVDGLLGLIRRGLVVVMEVIMLRLIVVVLVPVKSAHHTYLRTSLPYHSVLDFFTELDHV